MKKTLLIASVLALAVVGLHEADAGSKWYYTVQVNPTSRYAVGDMGTVRGSPDTTQYIGCWAYYWPGTSPSLTCSAQPLTGSAVMCTTNDPSMLSMFAAMQGDSLLRFEWEGGSCTEFLIRNGSQYQPKAP